MNILLSFEWPTILDNKFCDEIFWKGLSLTFSSSICPSTEEVTNFLNFDALVCYVMTPVLTLTLNSSEPSVWIVVKSTPCKWTSIRYFLVLGVSGSYTAFTSFVIGENENDVPTFIEGVVGLLFKPAFNGAPIGVLGLCSLHLHSTVLHIPLLWVPFN